MRNKKILLIGHGNHQFIINYVLYFKTKYDLKYRFDILSYDLIKNKHINAYNKILSLNYSSTFLSLLSRVIGVRRLLYFLKINKIIKKLNNYDFVHFHYISISSINLIKKISLKNIKIIITIWGSDLYKLESKYESKFYQSCLLAHKITFSNVDTMLFFKKKFAWTKNNLEICRFGLTPLKIIKEIPLSKDEAKKRLNWDLEKKAVVIGYNMSVYQQHLEIFNEFLNLTNHSNKILLIIPITYGGSKRYKNNILSKLKSLPFESIIYDEFLSDEQIAMMRIASDIMIQLQLTDQFSGSMQEHLYCRNIVITGSWLKYNTIKNGGGWFLEIDNIQSLSKVILNILNNYELFYSNTINNPEIIYNLSSWEKCINSWEKIYK